MIEKVSREELEKLRAIQASYESDGDVRDGAPFLLLLDWMEAKKIDLQHMVRVCEPGEIIMRENEPGDVFYLIRSGRAVVLKGAIKTPTVLGFRSTGDPLGEMALLEDLPRSATVVSLTTTSLWSLGRELFYEFLIENPRFSLKLLHMLSWRIRESDEDRLRGYVREKHQNEVLKTLSEQTIRDPLTGLFNRRHMDAILRDEGMHAMQYDLPLGIIIADIDFFKKVNDTYGHKIGDVVLQEMGTLLKSCVRAEDSLCRFGGEEFVIIMPGAGPSVLNRCAEEIRVRVESMPIECGEYQLQVTMSLGVASFPDHGRDASEILEHADMALYTAKHNGRNRVVIYSDDMMAD